MADIHGYRGKIGTVLPSTNTVVEVDYAALGLPGLSHHTARLTVVERPLDSDQAFLAHVEAMRSGIAAAIDQIATCRPNHLVMAVALEAFWGGVAKADALQKELEARSGLSVSMGGSASAAALKAFGIRRIAIITPHMPLGDAMVKLYFDQAGFDVVKLIGMKRGSPLKIATTTEAEMRAALHEVATSDCEAIVQVGTNLPMKALGVAAELWLGKPVLCINTVTYWDALRRMGVQDRIFGHGLILERF